MWSGAIQLSSHHVVSNFPLFVDSISTNTSRSTRFLALSEALVFIMSIHSLLNAENFRQKFNFRPQTVCVCACGYYPQIRHFFEDYFFWGHRFKTVVNKSLFIFLHLLFFRSWAQACECQPIIHIIWQRSREMYWWWYPVHLPHREQKAPFTLACHWLQNFSHRSEGWDIQPSWLLWGANSKCRCPHCEQASALCQRDVHGWHPPRAFCWTWR